MLARSSVRREVLVLLRLNQLNQISFMREGRRRGDENEQRGRRDEGCFCWVLKWNNKEQRWWMVGKSLASPMLSFQPAINCSFCTSDTAASAPRFSMHKLQLLDGLTPNICTNAIRGRDRISVCTSQKWAIHSTAKTQAIVLDDEERKMWEACRQALSPFNFSDMEEDKTLGKAFGQIQSPYWGEDRAKEVPKFETVNEILNYLRSLGLSDDDLGKLLKKFPEVLGCSLNEELMTNVCVLEKEWGIKGKSLRNLLLRNPKVLGYNVDCKGDCMAKCTRCWVRF